MEDGKMRVRCSQVRRWRRLALDGELGPKENEAFDRHVHECAACRSESERLLHAISLLSRMPVTQPREFFAVDVLARVRSMRQAQGQSTSRRAPWCMAAVVVATAACVVVGWNEWILPGFVTTMSDGLIVLAKSSTLLGSLRPLIGALSALSRSLAELALMLVRSSANHAISVYLLTLAITSISVLLVKTHPRTSDASALCL
jgi:predicted anti-sigma-YlaC factor YlaD